MSHRLRSVAVLGGVALALNPDLRALLQFVAAQDRVLRFQRDFVDTQREYWLALFDLERAIGARLDDAASKNAVPPIHSGRSVLFA